METLVANYSPTKDYNKILRDFVAEGTRGDKTTPGFRYNLGTLGSRISQFKKEVLEKHPDIEEPRPLAAWKSEAPEWKEYPDFAKLSIADKYRAQLIAKKAARRTPWEQFLLRFTFVPRNLVDLRLDEDESLAREASLDKRQKELSESTYVVNGNEMIAKLSALEGQDKYEELAALLLATGRRTAEVLKFGQFKVISENLMSMVGQLKAGLTPASEYQFPVLAPAPYLLDRINDVREKFNVERMTANQINHNVSTKLGKVTQKVFNVSPHKLRAIYAGLCAEVFRQKMEPVAYKSYILGHTEAKNGMYYNRAEINNYDKQTYKLIRENPLPELKTGASSAAQKLKNIFLQLVKDKQPITRARVQRLSGIWPLITRQYFTTNQAFVDAHNKSIAPDVAPASNPVEDKVRDAILQLIGENKQINLASVRALELRSPDTINKYLANYSEVIRRHNKTAK